MKRPRNIVGIASDYFAHRARPLTHGTVMLMAMRYAPVSDDIKFLCTYAVALLFTYVYLRKKGNLMSDIAMATVRTVEADFAATDRTRAGRLRVYRSVRFDPLPLECVVQIRASCLPVLLYIGALLSFFDAAFPNSMAIAIASGLMITLLLEGIDVAGKRSKFSDYLDGSAEYRKFLRSY